MRRMQFTLRDLFWLVLVVAMGIGWCLSYQRTENRAERAKSQAEKWRGRTGALEWAICSIWPATISWPLEKDEVRIDYQSPTLEMSSSHPVANIPTNEHMPTLTDPLDE